MKTLYLECNMGAAGDMLTAALTELMPDPDAFVQQLNDLQIPQVKIKRTTIAKCGGLADCPVIAVPTSVGYGASFGGLSALLSMLNSCASGVSVVNIDNGFGAGYMASMINHVSVKNPENVRMQPHHLHEHS